jgi:hypothetical protein
MMQVRRWKQDWQPSSHRPRLSFCRWVPTPETKDEEAAEAAAKAGKKPMYAAIPNPNGATLPPGHTRTAPVVDMARMGLMAFPSAPPPVERKVIKINLKLGSKANGLEAALPSPSQPGDDLPPPGDSPMGMG